MKPLVSLLLQLLCLQSTFFLCCDTGNNTRIFADLSNKEQEPRAPLPHSPLLQSWSASPGLREFRISWQIQGGSKSSLPVPSLSVELGANVQGSRGGSEYRAKDCCARVSTGSVTLIPPVVQSCLQALSCPKLGLVQGLGELLQGWAIKVMVRGAGIPYLPPKSVTDSHSTPRTFVVKIWRLKALFIFLVSSHATSG